MTNYQATRDGMKDALVLVRALFTRDHEATNTVIANTDPTELVCSLVSLLAGEIDMQHHPDTLAAIASRLAQVDLVFDRFEQS